MTTTLHTRWMLRRDLPAVLACGGDWTEGDLLTALARRDTIATVAQRGDDVIGYAVYRLHSHCIELLTLAVHPAHRRQRVGSALVGGLVEKVYAHLRPALVASVPEGDTAALLFLRACDLRAVRVERAAGAVRMEYRPSMEEWAHAACEVPANRIAAFLA